MVRVRGVGSVGAYKRGGVLIRVGEVYSWDGAG